MQPPTDAITITAVIIGVLWFVGMTVYSIQEYDDRVTDEDRLDFHENNPHRPE